MGRERIISNGADGSPVLNADALRAADE